MAQQGATGSAGTYNFYGDAGAIQTGSNATANVIQNLRAEDKATLIGALELVRDSLTLARDLAGGQKEELLQIMDDSVKEIKSDKPNNTKLRGVLSTIAAMVQTLGSTQPAYQAPKTALLPLGITLP